MTIIPYIKEGLLYILDTENNDNYIMGDYGLKIKSLKVSGNKIYIMDVDNKLYGFSTDDERTGWIFNPLLDGIKIKNFSLFDFEGQIAYLLENGQKIFYRQLASSKSEALYKVPSDSLEISNNSICLLDGEGNIWVSPDFTFSLIGNNPNNFPTDRYLQLTKDLNIKNIKSFITDNTGYLAVNEYIICATDIEDNIILIGKNRQRFYFAGSNEENLRMKIVPTGKKITKFYICDYFYSYLDDDYHFWLYEKNDEKGKIVLSNVKNYTAINDTTLLFLTVDNILKYYNYYDDYVNINNNRNRGSNIVNTNISVDFLPNDDNFYISDSKFYKTKNAYKINTD